MKQLNKNFSNKLQIATCIAIFVCIIILISNPSIYIKSTFNGIMVWATIVLPSLLPFFFLTKILINFKCLYTFSNKFSSLCKKLYNCHGISAYIFLMSVVSGYPVGAKLISEFHNNNIIDDGQAHRLISFCSTSGPMFIIGSVGVSLFCSKVAGIIIFLSHIISSLLNGLLYRKVKLYTHKEVITQPNFNTGNILSDSMYNTIISVLCVGGFIAISFMLVDMLSNLSIFYPLEALINILLQPFKISAGKPISYGLMEVTKGCIELSSLHLPMTTVIPIATGLVSFGGISVHLQSLSFLQSCKIKYRFFLLTKITHCIISVVTSMLLCLLI